MRHAPHFQRSFYFLLTSDCRPFHDQMRNYYYYYYYFGTLARSLEPVVTRVKSARSIPSVPKLKLMASRHQKKNTRTRRRGNLHHGVRKKGLSNYSSTNPLKSKFRRATSDYLDTALVLRCCIQELPAMTIRKMPSRRQCGNGISHAESAQ